MKVSVIAVGKTDRLLKDALEHYEKSAGYYWNIEVSEIKSGIAGRKKVSPGDVMKTESDRILHKIPTNAEVIALERTGKEMNSMDLSRYLQKCAFMTVSEIVFVIGGAFGLHQGLLDRADRVMRLSSFTFTHGFARLILLEQLYRAGTIIRKEPYHKGAL